MLQDGHMWAVHWWDLCWFIFGRKETEDFNWGENKFN